MRFIALTLHSLCGNMYIKYSVSILAKREREKDGGGERRKKRGD